MQLLSTGITEQYTSIFFNDKLQINNSNGSYKYRESETGSIQQKIPSSLKNPICICIVNFTSIDRRYSYQELHCMGSGNVLRMSDNIILKAMLYSQLSNGKKISCTLLLQEHTLNMKH